MAKNTGITRKQLKNAAPVGLVLGQFPVVANPREFSTGSLGWFANGKVPVTLADGTIVQCQVSCNITAIGSKEMPEE